MHPNQPDRLFEPTDTNAEQEGVSYSEYLDLVREVASSVAALKESNMPLFTPSVSSKNRTSGCFVMRLY